MSSTDYVNYVCHIHRVQWMTRQAGSSEKSFLLIPRQLSEDKIFPRSRDLNQMPKKKVRDGLCKLFLVINSLNSKDDCIFKVRAHFLARTAPTPPPPSPTRA